MLDFREKTSSILAHMDLDDVSTLDLNGKSTLAKVERLRSAKVC